MEPEFYEMLRRNPFEGYVTPKAVYVADPTGNIFVIVGDGKTDFTALTDDEVNDVITDYLSRAVLVNPEMN